MPSARTRALRRVGRIDGATREQRGWPIQPVVDHLLRRLGEYHHHDNPDGYCSATAELHTGIHRTTWQRYVKRGWLDAAQADRVATALGLHPRALWPSYDTAIEPDPDFLETWDAARTGVQASDQAKPVIGCVWGVHQQLIEYLEDDAPSYDWCEAQYEAIRNNAPPPGDKLPPWLLNELTTRWAEEMLAELG